MSTQREAFFKKAIEVATGVNKLAHQDVITPNKQQIIAQTAYLIGFLEGGLEMEQYDKTTK